MNADGNQTVTISHCLNLSHGLRDSQAVSGAKHLGKKSCGRYLGTNCPYRTRK
jgi:hypothetical protein